MPFFYKVLERLQILVSMGVPRTNPLWKPRDRCGLDHIIIIIKLYTGPHFLSLSFQFAVILYPG